MVPGSNSKLDKRMGQVEQTLAAQNDALAKISKALGLAADTEVGGQEEPQHVDTHPDLAEAEAMIHKKVGANPMGGMMVVRGPRGAEMVDMYATRLGLLQDAREARNPKFGASKKLR